MTDIDNSKNQFLLWESSTRDTIDFKKTYVDMSGDVLAGLMLSEIVYWYLPNKRHESKLRINRDGYEWLAVSREDWWQRVRLTPRQIDTTAKKLIECGLIEKRLFKFAGVPTVHYRIVWERFLVLFNHFSQNPILQNGEMELTKSVRSISPKPTNPYTETTTETTEKPLSAIADTQVVKDDTTIVTIIRPKSNLPLHPALKEMLGMEAPTPDTPKSGRVAPKNPLFCEPLKGALCGVLANYSFNVDYERLDKVAQGKLFKSRLSPILKELLSLHQNTPLTGDELQEAFRWWRKHNKKANFPAGANTVYTMLIAYRQAKADYEAETKPTQFVPKTLPDGTIVYGEIE